MKAKIQTSNKAFLLFGKIKRALSFLLIFSMLASCASFYKLDWEPTSNESQDYYKVRNQNFELLKRNKHYRIFKKDDSVQLVYLEGFHDTKLFVIDYTESGKFNKNDEILTEIPIDDIQEIEAKYHPGSSVLLTIGAAGFFVTMFAIFGIDFFLPEDDDI